MKIFIHEESGSAYRINQEDAVEYQPLNQNGMLDTDDFTEVEYDLVGDETITHNGKEITINEFQKTIRCRILANC